MRERRKYNCFMIIILVLIFMSISCVNDSVDRHHPTLLEMREYCGLDDRLDSNDILKTRYPYTFIIPITPKDSHFHAQGLLNAEARAEVAYHIIALGLIGENSPEVMLSLDCARYRFGGEPVPNHFDWPDSIEHFRNELKQNPELTVADTPGSRGIHFDFLIVECIDRITKPEDIPDLRWTVEE